MYSKGNAVMVLKKNTLGSALLLKQALAWRSGPLERAHWRSADLEGIRSQHEQGSV
jgi:hypothetical protein